MQACFNQALPLKTNKTQHRVIACALLAFLLATFFPPWVTVRNHRNAGYGLLFRPPAGTIYDSATKIDTSRLMLEWSVIIVLAASGVFFMRHDTVQASPSIPAAAEPHESRFPLTKRMVFAAIALLLVYAAAVVAVTILAVRLSARKSQFDPSKAYNIQERVPEITFFLDEATQSTFFIDLTGKTNRAGGRDIWDKLLREKSRTKKRDIFDDIAPD
jgi:hypothetical protein